MVSSTVSAPHTKAPVLQSCPCTFELVTMFSIAIAGARAASLRRSANQAARQVHNVTFLCSSFDTRLSITGDMLGMVEVAPGYHRVLTRVM